MHGRRIVTGLLGGLIVGAGGCLPSARPPAGDASVQVPTTAPLHEVAPAAGDEPALRVVGLAALNDETCVWTQAGRAVCVSPEGTRVLPVRDVEALTIHSDGWVVRTKDGRVLDLYRRAKPTDKPKELEPLRGASKVLCSRHFCGALVEGQLKKWVFVHHGFEDARQGDGLVDFTGRDGVMLGRREDGEIRRYDHAGSKDGQVLAPAGQIVSDCIHGIDHQLRCGDTAPVMVPTGVRLTTGVGVLRSHLPRDARREVCGVDEAGGAWCYGPPLGRPTQDPAAFGWSRVAGIEDAATVVGGGRHACVLTSGHRVKCWGAYEMGQYGIRPDTTTPGPIDAPGLDDSTARLLVTDDKVCLVGTAASVCTDFRDYTWQPYALGDPTFLSRDDDLMLWVRGREVSVKDPWEDRHKVARLPPRVGIQEFVECDVAGFFLLDDGTLAAARDESIAHHSDQLEPPPLHTLRRVPKVRDLVDVACIPGGVVSLDSSGVVRVHAASGAPRTVWFEGASALATAGPTVCAQIKGQYECRVLTDAPRSVSAPSVLEGVTDLRGRTRPALDEPLPRDRMCGRTPTGIRCIQPVAKLGTDELEVTDTPLAGRILAWGFALDHACARIASGEILCWGNPAGYRLGRSFVHAPVDVTERFVTALRVDTVGDPERAMARE